MHTEKILNGVDLDRLGATVEAITADRSLARFQFRTANRWIDGGHNRSAIKEFYGAGHEDDSRDDAFIVDSDEPLVLLGRDQAPNAGEHLLHALASCLTSAIVYHAAARGIVLDTLECNLEGDLDLHGFLELDKNVRKGYQAIRVNFRIKADVPEERLQEIVQLGTGHSPVFDSLTKGVPVSVKAERL